MYKLKKSVWIGLSDLSGFQRFVWSNNDPVTETYWASFQPQYSKVGYHSLPLHAAEFNELGLIYFILLIFILK